MIVPISIEIQGVLDPLAVYRRLAAGGIRGALLESGRYHPRIGRYAFVAVDPFLVFRARGEQIQVEEWGRTTTFRGHPIGALRAVCGRYRAARVPGLPPFAGGAVACLGYDLGQWFERLPRRALDDRGWPDLVAQFFDTVVCVDHAQGRTVVIGSVLPTGDWDAAYARAVERVEAVADRLSTVGRAASWTPDRRPALPGAAAVPHWQSNVTPDEFLAMVRRAKAYIAAGDIFQANLAQRLAVDVSADGLTLYEALREINPSPFAAYVELGDLQVIGASPERLVRLEQRRVETRPIAGTRPRGGTVEEDLARSWELLLSDKERAEHIMLVDLERNDLGRVCEPGTVRVDEFLSIEEYSHVLHIVSNVSGVLRSTCGPFDLLRAMFPGGTVTGVPKIRCMEIIDELEPHRRGFAYGAVGYLAFTGDLDLNLVIRTMVKDGGTVFLHVGAGIVADSDPVREYEETVHKARAMLEACAVTEAGAWTAAPLHH